MLRLVGKIIHALKERIIDSRYHYQAARLEQNWHLTRSPVELAAAGLRRGWKQPYAQMGLHEYTRARNCYKEQPAMPRGSPATLHRRDAEIDT